MALRNLPSCMPETTTTMQEVLLILSHRANPVLKFTGWHASGQYMYSTLKLSRRKVTHEILKPGALLSQPYQLTRACDQHQSLLVIYPSGFVNTLMQKLSGNIEALPKS